MGDSRYANFKHRGNVDQAIAAMRFTDNFGAATEAYRFNPNGSLGGFQRLDATLGERVPLGGLSLFEVTQGC